MLWHFAHVWMHFFRLTGPIFIPQERTGTALFILYKAIKVQVEKGPLDYITACGKYTLSEQNLFTAADADINAKPLVSSDS